MEGPNVITETRSGRWATYIEILILLTAVCSSNLINSIYDNPKGPEETLLQRFCGVIIRKQG